MEEEEEEEEEEIEEEEIEEEVEVSRGGSMRRNMRGGDCGEEEEEEEEGGCWRWSTWLYVDVNFEGVMGMVCAVEMKSAKRVRAMMLLAVLVGVVVGG